MAIIIYPKSCIGDAIRIADNPPDSSEGHLHGIGTITQLLWLGDSGNPLVQTEASLSVKECIRRPIGSPSVLVSQHPPQPANDDGIEWAPV